MVLSQTSMVAVIVIKKLSLADWEKNQNVY